MNPARLFLLGIALVALHAADGAFVHVEPGASRAAHLPWAAIALLGAAVVLRWRNELSSGVRGSIAAVVGLLAASDGLQHALYAGQTRGAAGWTGLLMLPAAAALLTSAVWSVWGVNRGRRRSRAWLARAGTLAASVLVLLFVVEPVALAVYTAHKPRRALGTPDLGAGYRDVSFRSTDGLDIHAWWVKPRNGAAIVLVHGSGGDRTGPRRQARMLVRAGYGVLVLDARGRGRSEGDNESLGWTWDRDVRGAVTWLRGQGIDRIGALGLSTGAETLLQAAAEDTRIRAVVSDGAQARSTKELRRYEAAPRWFILPNFWVTEQTYKVLEHRDAPESLATLVPRIAPRPLLLISTGASYERDMNREWRRLAGPTAQLWELPDTKHTQGLQTHPAQYRQHVLSLFDHALLGQREV
jgi:uncharacterized protein